MKAGTKVTILSATPETGRVLRWHPVSGKREEVPGYERVKFDADGAVLLVHESYLREAA